MVSWLPLLASLIFHGYVASDNATQTLAVGKHDALFETAEAPPLERMRREDPVVEPPENAAYYDPNTFQKYFYKSLAWLNPVKCIATFISHKVAVVPCECVVEEPTSYKVNHLTHEAWKETENGETLKTLSGDFSIGTFFPNNTWTGKVKKTYPHPNCTSLMKYNIALIEVDQPYDWIRIAWVHTPEDILFSNNMRRIVAGQAIAGRCVTPWIDYNETLHDGQQPPKTWEVDFQYWDACRPIVCPEWRREQKRFSDYVRTFEKASDVPYVRNVCVDEVDKTKFCVRIRIPLYQREPDSCSLPPGLPVYCNMGQYSGLFGFIVSRTFACSSASYYDLAIFQPLSVAVPFIKNYLMIIKDPSYHLIPENVYSYIPKWAIGVARKPPTQTEYNPATVRQAVPRSGPVINSLLQTFADDQADAIVNVYYETKNRDHFRCHGVQFTPNKYIVPCFCVHKNDYDINKVRWGDPQHYAEVLEDKNLKIVQLQPEDMNVRHAKYDNGEPRKCRPVIDDVSYKKYGEKTPLVNWDADPYCHFLAKIYRPDLCNTNAMFDFAYVESKVPLQWAKNVWIHSPNYEYMKTMMTILPVSSLLGGQCFVLNFTYFPKDPDNPQVLRSVKITKIDVVFSPWDFCLPLLCDPDYNYPKEEKWQTELCFNLNLDGVRGSPFSGQKRKWKGNARECISSAHGEPICDLPDGTPMFCDTDELRGLVGIISKINMPGCTQTKKNFQDKVPREEVDRYDANSSAIIMKLSDYLPIIAKETIIYKITNTDVFKNRLSRAPWRVSSLLLTSLSVLLTSGPVLPQVLKKYSTF